MLLNRTLQIDQHAPIGAEGHVAASVLMVAREREPLRQRPGMKRSSSEQHPVLRIDRERVGRRARCACEAGEHPPIDEERAQIVEHPVFAERLRIDGLGREQDSAFIEKERLRLNEREQLARLVLKMQTEGGAILQCESLVKRIAGPDRADLEPGWSGDNVGSFGRAADARAECHRNWNEVIHSLHLFLVPDFTLLSFASMSAGSETRPPRRRGWG